MAVQEIAQDLSGLVSVLLGHEQLDRIDPRQDLGPEPIGYDAGDASFLENAFRELRVQARGLTAERSHSHKVHVNPPSI